MKLIPEKNLADYAAGSLSNQLHGRLRQKGCTEFKARLNAQ